MQRQNLVLCLYLAIFALIIIRLFYWQMIKGPTLSQAAADQYYFTLELTPKRGEILAADDNPLVTNQNAYLVFAENKKITDVDNFYQKVTQVLDLETDNLLERLNQSQIVWVPIQHKVDEDKLLQLKQLDLVGLGFEKEDRRLYPEASMAAHLLGFVGSDENGVDTGYFGIEGFYNQALKGKNGYLIEEKDARGLSILLGSTKRIEAEDGQALQLYLDRTVQMIIEDNLKKALEKYGAKGGLIVVSDPTTGGILGSSSYPNFDPGKFSLFEKEYYPNPLISFTYEPGSTFKTLVMAAALNEGKVDVKTKYNEEGPIQIDDYLIRTWNNQYHGEITATQIIEKSSNPGMVFVSRQLGLRKFYQYLKQFGFGQTTGIDVEGEEVALLRPENEWKEIDLATASFGQGIAITPIQMLTAVSALANNGKLIEPKVVKKMVDPKGAIIEHKPKKIRQVVRSTTAKVITEMMINAVDKGEAKWAKPAGFRIAGKTGTAQIPVAGHYDTEKTIASFIGFAPADKPKFIMLVILREPSTSPWGSETAAPLFFQITKELFAYYGISPRN